MRQMLGEFPHGVAGHRHAVRLAAAHDRSMKVSGDDAAPCPPGFGEVPDQCGKSVVELLLGEAGSRHALRKMPKVDRSGSSFIGWGTGLGRSVATVASH